MSVTEWIFGMDIPLTDPLVIFVFLTIIAATATGTYLIAYKLKGGKIKNLFAPVKKESNTARKKREIRDERRKQYEKDKEEKEKKDPRFF